MNILLLGFGAAIAIVVCLALAQNGLALVCGMEGHTHSEACYESQDNGYSY